MKRIGIVALFPSICLGVAFLCVNSVKLGSRENGYIHSLNQAVEIAGTDVEQVSIPESTEATSEAEPVVNQENPEAESPEAESVVNQENPSEESETPPAIPEAPAEIKVEVPTESEEAPAVVTKTPAATPNPVPAPVVKQENAAVPNPNADDVINNLIDQLGALMAQKVTEQVHAMMQERVQMRLKTFIKDELKRIMEACPVDVLDEMVEARQQAPAQEEMNQSASRTMSDEQMMPYMNHNDADMIGSL